MPPSDKLPPHLAPASPSAAPPVEAPEPTFAEAVARAMESLDAVEASLKLEIVLRQNDRAQLMALKRVPLAALRLASDIVAKEPGRFRDFSDLEASTSYVETLAPLAARLRTFGKHVDTSLLNHHGPAALRTLVLYKMVKSLGRLAVNQTMREKAKELHAAIVPRRYRTAPKQTHAQKMAKQAAKRLAARVAKAKAVLAASDPTGQK